MIATLLFIGFIQRMEDHALISRQILNHLNEDARGAIRFASFASNIQIIADLYQKIACCTRARRCWRSACWGRAASCTRGW